MLSVRNPSHESTARTLIRELENRDLWAPVDDEQPAPDLNAKAMRVSDVAVPDSPHSLREYWTPRRHFDRVSISRYPRGSNRRPSRWILAGFELTGPMRAVTM